MSGSLTNLEKIREEFTMKVHRVVPHHVEYEPTYTFGLKHHKAFASHIAEPAQL